MLVHMRHSWGMIKFLKMLVIGAGIGAIGAGCCTTVPVRLIDKPMGVKAIDGVAKGKIAVVVRDMRPEAIQKTNMCGVNHQTIFLIPVAPIFLAHLEHLDTIVSHYAKKTLEHNGYGVVSIVPEPPSELSDKRLAKKELDSSELDAAWGAKGSQKRDKREFKQLRKEHKKDGGAVVAERLDEETISPWGPELDTSQADYVLELKIKKFWTSYNYWGSFSWMTMNYALCDAQDKYRTVLHGEKLKGVGYFFSFFTPLTPVSDVNVSMNSAYWFVLNGLQDAIRDLDLRQVASDTSTSSLQSEQQ